MPIIQTTKQLRPREKDDFYPTPIELCREALTLSGFFDIDTALDPGCGTGVWGQALRNEFPRAFIMGIDIIDRLPQNHVYDMFVKDDFLTHKMDAGDFDLIVGNPPYKFAEKFVRKSYELLHPEGELILLLRLAFLEGQKRCKGLWKELFPAEVHVLGRRPSFTGNGKTDSTAYAIFKWVKGQTWETTLNWLDWDYDD